MVGTGPVSWQAPDGPVSKTFPGGELGGEGTLGGTGRIGLALREDQLLPVRGDLDGFALHEGPPQDLLGQGVLQLALDGAALEETMFLDRSGSNSMFGGWVGPNGSARNLWPLPGGEYVLNVAFDGFVAQDLPIKIEPKSTVRHAVQLQRAP